MRFTVISPMAVFQDACYIPTNLFSIVYENKQMIVDEDMLDRNCVGPWMYVLGGNAYLRTESSKTGIQYLWQLKGLKEFETPEKMNVPRAELTFRLCENESPSYLSLPESQRDWKLYVYAELSRDYWDLRGKLKDSGRNLKLKNTTGTNPTNKTFTELYVEMYNDSVKRYQAHRK